MPRHAKYPYIDDFVDNEVYVFSTIGQGPVGPKGEKGDVMYPEFADPIDWNKGTDYPENTVVLYEGASYLSKQAVPHGIDISNTRYWVLTNDYNAQIEAYKQKVIQQIQDVSALKAYAAKKGMFFYDTSQNSIYEIVDVRPTGNNGYTPEYYELDNGLFALRVFNNLFRKNTFGTWNNAAVLSAINDTRERVEVQGMADSYSPALYDTRDSVGFFNSVRGKNPTLTVPDTNNIVYGSDYVEVGEGVSLDDVMAGMIIDTNHTTPYSAIISHVVEGKIYIKVGWYLKGSTSPSIPPSGYGFKVDAITSIWNVNTRTKLENDEETNQAILWEADLINNKTGADFRGIGFRNMGSRTTYAALVTSNDGEYSGFQIFALLNAANTGIRFNCFEPSDIASIHPTILEWHDSENDSVRGYIERCFNNDSSLKYTKTPEGQVTRIGLVSGNIASGDNDGTNSLLSNLGIDHSSASTVTIKKPTISSGEIYVVSNVNNYVQTIVCENESNFIVGGAVSDSIKIPPRGSCVLISCANAWKILYGNAYIEKTLSYANVTFTLKKTNDKVVCAPSNTAFNANLPTSLTAIGTHDFGFIEDKMMNLIAQSGNLYSLLFNRNNSVYIRTYTQSAVVSGDITLPAQVEVSLI